MTEKLDDRELVNFKELLMTNNYQADALVQLFRISQKIIIIDLI